MRYLPILFLLAMPLSAGVTPHDPVDKLADFSLVNLPVKHIVGYCEAVIDDWATESCTGSVYGTTYVDAGICTQAEADSGSTLPMVTCVQWRVTKGECTASAINTEIPQWGKCSNLFTRLIRGLIRNAGKDGLAKRWRRNQVEPGDLGE